MHPTLSQINFDDWAEIAVIAVVILGSLFANVASSFKKKMEERREEAERQRRMATPPTAPPATSQHYPPPLSTPEHGHTPPIAPPIPTATLRPDTQGELERLRRRARERQARGQFAPPPPVVKPVPQASDYQVREQRSAEEEARQRDLRRRQRAEQESRNAAQQQATVRKVAAQKKADVLKDSTAAVGETFDERAARMDRQRDRRIGHVEEGLVAAEPEEKERPAAEVRDDATRRRLRLTTQSLREAIILNEILAPPLALRPSNDL